MESRHLIIGAGEIGRSMKAVLEEGGLDVQIRDIESDIVGQFNYLHIAIPFRNREEFLDTVRGYEELYSPHTVIVHTTVGVGTIREMGEKAVHVPLRGKHPHLAEGIRVFRMYVGGNDVQRVKDVAELYRELGIDTYLIDPTAYPPETTELLKLMCTSYYGWNILFEKEMHRICEEYKVPFEVVYTDLNKTYNQGYEQLGSKQFVRPVLDHFPGPNGGCGGHCVIENCILMHQAGKGNSDWMMEAIMSMGKATPGDKPYLDYAWLYAEYWGKRRSSSDIGKQFGITGSSIVQIMRRRGIPTRSSEWSKEELDIVLEALRDGLTLVDIHKKLPKRTYQAIRSLVYNVLELRSGYDPSAQDEETRKKISASLQGIPLSDWDGFKEKENALIRKSCAYQDWRNAVFIRDDYTCQDCGSRGGYLHAHHILPFAKHPEVRLAVDNGKTLCRECHAKIHPNLKREKGL